jgi:hypothetical protein
MTSTATPADRDERAKVEASLRAPASSTARRPISSPRERKPLGLGIIADEPAAPPEPDRPALLSDVREAQGVGLEATGEVIGEHVDAVRKEIEADFAARLAGLAELVDAQRLALARLEGRLEGAAAERSRASILRP